MDFFKYNFRTTFPTHIWIRRRILESIDCFLPAEPNYELFQYRLL